MKHVLTTLGTGSLLLLVCGAFAPKEPAAPAQPTPPPSNVIITPVIPAPKGPKAPSVLDRFPIVVDQRNPADYPIVVAQGQAARYPIRIIPPAGMPLAQPLILPAPQAVPVKPKVTPSLPRRKK